ATIVFSPAFGGAKSVWATWFTAGYVGHGWQLVGSWTVPAAPPPAGLSVSPASGSGSAQRFTFTFGGVSNPSELHILINSTLNGLGSCYLIYQPQPINTLDIATAAGNSVLSRVTPGGGGTLSNSQCSVSASNVVIVS